MQYAAPAYKRAFKNESDKPVERIVNLAGLECVRSSAGIVLAERLAAASFHVPALQPPLDKIEQALPQRINLLCIHRTQWSVKNEKRQSVNG